MDLISDFDRAEIHITTVAQKIDWMKTYYVLVAYHETTSASGLIKFSKKIPIITRSSYLLSAAQASVAKLFKF